MKETKFKEGDTVVLVDEEVLHKWRKTNNYKEINSDVVKALKSGIIVAGFRENGIFDAEIRVGAIAWFYQLHTSAFALKGAK